MPDSALIDPGLWKAEAKTQKVRGSEGGMGKGEVVDRNLWVVKIATDAHEHFFYEWF